MEEVKLATFGRLVIYGRADGKLRCGKNGKWKPAPWVLSNLDSDWLHIVRSAAEKHGLYTISTASNKTHKRREKLS